MGFSYPGYGIQAEYPSGTPGQSIYYGSQVQYSSNQGMATSPAMTYTGPSGLNNSMSAPYLAQNLTLIGMGMDSEGNQVKLNGDPKPIKLFANNATGANAADPVIKYGSDYLSASGEPKPIIGNATTISPEPTGTNATAIKSSRADNSGLMAAVQANSAGGQAKVAGNKQMQYNGGSSGATSMIVGGNVLVKSLLGS